MKARVRQGKFWAYIVECGDGTYYTGSTNNLEHRLKLHNAGNGAKYVRGKGPVRLVYEKAYRYYKRAVQAEYRLKRLTRDQKQALIGDYARQNMMKREMDRPADLAPTAPNQRCGPNRRFAGAP